MCKVIAVLDSYPILVYLLVSIMMEMVLSLFPVHQRYVLNLAEPASLVEAASLELSLHLQGSPL